MVGSLAGKSTACVTTSLKKLKTLLGIWVQSYGIEINLPAAASGLMPFFKHLIDESVRNETNKHKKGCNGE